jgi:hypothetical protein
MMVTTAAVLPHHSPVPPSTPSLTQRRSGRRWPAVTAVIVGAVLVAGAVAWQAWAVPALVRFPTDVDQRLRYEGTFTLFVDPETAGPLSAPAVHELTVDRHVEGVPAESDRDLVVVRETIAYDVAGLVAATQVHQYVMDRRTNVNVADDRAWAFDAANQLDRSGAFWLALPGGLTAGSAVPMYKDEIGATFVATGVPASESVGDVQVIGVTAGADAQPLTDAYLRSLDAVLPLPRSLGFDRMKPSLVAAGLPVDDAVFKLAGLATPEDLAALGVLIAEPIPLEYVDSFTGKTLVDERTGAIVAVTSVVERVGVRPSPTALPALLDILQRYRDDATVAALVAGLERLATDPLPVFEYRYRQTPASVEAIAEWVAGQHDRIGLAERSIPLALFTAGVVAMVTGSFSLSRRRAGAVEPPRGASRQTSTGGSSRGS